MVSPYGGGRILGIVLSFLAVLCMSTPCFAVTAEDFDVTGINKGSPVSSGLFCVVDTVSFMDKAMRSTPPPVETLKTYQVSQTTVDFQTSADACADGSCATGFGSGGGPIKRGGGLAISAGRGLGRVIIGVDRRERRQSRRAEGRGLFGRRGCGG